jgi:hypothetical protein
MRRIAAIVGRSVSIASRLDLSSMKAVDVPVHMDTKNSGALLGPQPSRSWRPE